MSGVKLSQLKQACKMFVDGAERTASQTGLRENIAIVEFGARTRTVVQLTNNYDIVRRGYNSLTADGGTPMGDGLVEALKELLTRGGIVRIAGICLKPRIILVTDGHPDDKEEAAKCALAFGPAAEHVGLPYSVPICAIGVGSDCDTQLLQVMAHVTDGKQHGKNSLELPGRGPWHCGTQSTGH